MAVIRQKITSQENTLPEATVKMTEVVDHLHETPRTYQQKVAIFRAYQLIWYLLGIIETLLVFRVILKLIAANPGSPFSAFIYNISYPFAYPFLGMVATPVIPNGSVFEWSSLIGMLVYAAVAYGLIYLFQLIKPTNPDEVEEEVDEV